MLNALLIILFVVLPFIVLLGFAFMPARWNKVFFLVAGLAILLTWSIFPGSSEERIPVSALLKTVQAVLMVLAIAVGASIQWAWRLWRSRWTLSVQAAADNQPDWPNAAFGGLLAASTPARAAYHGAFGRVDGYMLFLALTIVVVLLGVMLVIFRLSGRLALLVASALCALSIFAIAIYALYTGWLVQAAAHTAAQGNDYCIQSGNRPVTSLLDLTFLNMRAPTSAGVHLNFHGLLVVREKDATQTYNWSYWQRRFVPARMTYRPDAVCTPR